ncbi:MULTISPECIES: hypothetical protein [Enterobacterales]|nr:MULTISPECIES: hypothetical protein [Enterobacterales]EEQ16075.1 hypothetical protein yfred0001_21720 [Yersinia frederiksenii ATCC 33641]
MSRLDLCGFLKGSGSISSGADTADFCGSLFFVWFSEVEALN